MTPQQLDAVVVGAGFGGIGAAIQLRRLGYDNFVILEREDDLGGTWHVNRYPGLAVDIPSTTYSYWFEPNPNWSRLFAPGEELKRYADDVADKYDVRRHMRFSTTVEGARWDEDAKTWHVALADGETLTARFLITATGFLSQPHTPDIPGITEFDGRIIHTTDWDDDYDFTGRRIGVIGTGATAVQLIPKLAERVADMTVYQRTPIYVVPKFDFPIARAAAAALRPGSSRAPCLSLGNRQHLRADDGVGRAALPAVQTAQQRGCRAGEDPPVRDRSATRNSAASSPRTTTSAVSGRPSRTPTTAHSPSRTSIWSPPRSNAWNRTAS